MFWRSVLGCAGALALIVGAPAKAAEADRSLAQQDPAFHAGVLPNGLRYAVMRSATPKGAISIRFAVDVGSYEETEAERGLAHFVEHMAFRATRNYEEGRLEQELATVGVGAGRDHNAFTDMFSTLYLLDLPDGDAAHLNLAFRWLRDVADGVLFAPEAVERERGVVLAEKEARNSNDQVAQARIEQFQTPGLRSAARAPIGLETVLRTAKPEDLRRFHDRWYRPENAMVAVAGDLPVETLEAWVRGAFETWRAEGPAPARASLNPSDKGRLDMGRAPDALAISDPGLPPRIRACRLGPADPLGDEDLATRRGQAARDLWMVILNARLAERADHDPALLDADIGRTDWTRDVGRTCLAAAPRGGDRWDEALAAADAELRRLRRDGPTEQELENALERRRADLRGGISVVATEATTDLADEMIHTLLTRTTFAEPRELLRAYGQEVEDLTPAQLRATVERDWSGAGPLIDAVGPAPPDRAALLRAWAEAEAAPVPAPYVDPPAPKWAYGDFGPPGRVARREVLAAPGFVRLTFRNGVVLNFKQTAFSKEAAEVRVVFGAGRREIAGGELFKARVASSLVVLGGLGRQSYREIDAALAPVDWDFDLDVEDDDFLLSATPLTDNLYRQLQVMTAYLSDPGFRPQMDSRIPATVERAYRNFRTDPTILAASAPYALLAPLAGQTPPPRDAFGPLTSAEVARLFRSPMTEAPLEVTLVGDLDERTATELVARTFGALPPRPERPRARGDVVFLRYSDPAPAPVRLSHDGPGDRAVVSLTWPLFVADARTRREEAAADLLAAVFADALTHGARDRLGKTYSPEASAYAPDGGDQGNLEALIETYPADVEAVRAEALAVAARLARGQITAAELEAARAPRLRALAASSQTNSGWADQLAGSSRAPQRLRDFDQIPRLTAEVGLDEVRAAAGRWLSAAPVQVTVLPGPKEAPR